MPTVLSRCFVLLAVLAASPSARPDDFRIESTIFAGDQQQPTARNLTLFQQEIVYDFLLTGPREITIYDAQRKRFTLLDVHRKMKTSVATEELVKITTKIKIFALENGAPLIRFAADPDFQETFDDSRSLLTLKNTLLTYRVKTIQAPNPKVMRTYRQFSDWYARLNSTQPGLLPPFARLDLNKALAARGLIPTEVERTTQYRLRRTKPRKARSEHVCAWRLLPEDQQRLEEAKKYGKLFRDIPFHQYRRTKTVAAKTASKRR